MNEIWCGEYSQPIARLSGDDRSVYAVDDRPPLRWFPFYKVEPYSKPFAHYRVPKLQAVEFVPDGAPPERAEILFTACVHGPAAPYPEVPTPEQILASALDLDLGNGL